MDLTSTIIKRVEAFIDANDLLQGISHLGLAVSGGSDSMTLLHIIPKICKKRGIETIILCFDHAIEGENSEAEAEFVKQAAIKARLPYDIEKADPPVQASVGLSMEMAARNARRDFFLRMASKHNLDAIATGHQQNDVAETLLIRLFRGAGATGLSGLRPKSEAQEGVAPTIIRPLLPFGRDELRSFLISQSIPWMDDVSNANEEIQRNRIRLKVLPALTKTFSLEEGVLAKAVSQSAVILRDEDKFLDSLAEEWLSKHKDNALPYTELEKQPKALARRIVHKWLIKNGPSGAASFQVIEAILEKNVSSVNLPTGLALHIRNGLLQLETQRPVENQPPKGIELKLGVNYWGDYTITLSEATEIVKEKKHLGSWPASCTLSKAMLKDKTIFVRARQEGDFIRPLGLKGSKKIQDIFVDEKLSKEERTSYPLLLCDNELIWLPGYKISANYAAKEKTPLLRIEISK